MSIANVYFLPEFTLLILLLIAFLVFFLKFSALRKYRRKRNIIFYATSIIMLCLLAALTYDGYQGLALVSYEVESKEPFFAGQINQLDVTSKNLGIRAASYYLVINSTNATLTANSADCIQINETAIKVFFNLHNLDEESTKHMAFRMNENVTGCQFYISTERSSNLPAVTGSTVYAYTIYDNRTGHYSLTSVVGPVV